MVLKATDRKRLVVFLYSFLRKEEVKHDYHRNGAL